PEAPQAARHLEQQTAARGARAGPVEGGPDVVVLDGQSGEPRRLVGPGQLALATANELGEELQMATAILDDLARLHQLLLGILPDAAEQSVPSGAVLLLDDDKVAGDQVVEQIEHVEGVEAVTRRHRLGPFEGPPAAEHREPAQ